VKLLGSAAVGACQSAPLITSVRDRRPRPASEEADAGSRAPRPRRLGQLPRRLYEAPPAEKVLVYAHSGSDLFSVDPMTLQISRSAPSSSGPPTKYLNDVTDIAIDRDGRIVGTTFNRLLEIDGKTAECKPIAPCRRPLVQRLSWIRTDAGEERLLATTVDGGVFPHRFPPPARHHAGPLGGGLKSSGDIVSVASYGTLVTLTGPGSDRLARIDPYHRAATVIGDTGFQKVWAWASGGTASFASPTRRVHTSSIPRPARDEGDSIPAFPFWARA
jgi:hypothetical protein